jgi:hypothetical protein
VLSHLRVRRARQHRDTGKGLAVGGVAGVVGAVVREPHTGRLARREAERAQACEQRGALEPRPRVDDEAVARAAIEHQDVRDDEAAEAVQQADDV